MVLHGKSPRRPSVPLHLHRVQLLRFRGWKERLVSYLPRNLQRWLGRCLDFSHGNRKPAQLQSANARQNGRQSQWIHLRCQHLRSFTCLGPICHSLQLGYSVQNLGSRLCWTWSNHHTILCGDSQRANSFLASY